MAEAVKEGIYSCSICGNIVEMVRAGGGELVCCGKPMDLLEEKSADSSTEKHVPVIEAVDGGFKVTVGSTLHPMTQEHYIQWIELLAGDRSYRAYLKPGDAPEAYFCVDADLKDVSAREFCNLHGLWKG
ncbi:MAG: desulfoferrodoxin [Spirochaetia bacterium]|nr:desulfoferrodoxin [Spirochaetia bacterium]MCF7941679.1 desulfoferrodoxin [Spirochaetia bacterium]